MEADENRLLVVGETTSSTQALIEQLSQRGTECASARSVHEAIVSLRNSHFDAVLATEILPDGRAYELMPAVEKSGGNLLVAIALSESSLWLPVVDRGRRVLGSRALNANMLASELERLTMAPVPPAVRMANSFRSADGASRSARSKILARRAAALPLHLETRASLDARRESIDPEPLLLSAVPVAEKEGRDVAGRFARLCRRTGLGNSRTA